ncbi:MAG: YciI family protein [Candidatus Thorarchaeota archaeon]
MKTYVVWMKVKAPEKIQEVLPAHLEHLETLKKDGTLIISGPFVIPEKSGGMMIFRAESFDAAKEIMESDPFIVEGVEDYDLCELAMTVHSPRDFVSYH